MTDKDKKMTDKPKPPALDPSTVEARPGTNYPAAFKGPVAARLKRRLGDAVGLSQFGVNLVTLEPGVWSSQRHWHAEEDEFLYVLEGELTLVTDAGEQVLGPGMAAGFPAGKPDGHHLINKGASPAVYLEVGGRSALETVEYPDIDLRVAGGRFTDKQGKPY